MNGSSFRIQGLALAAISDTRSEWVFRIVRVCACTRISNSKPMSPASFVAPLLLACTVGTSLYACATTPLRAARALAPASRELELRAASHTRGTLSEIGLFAA